jgi:hypothetical protein
MFLELNWLFEVARQKKDSSGRLSGGLNCMSAAPMPPIVVGQFSARVAAARIFFVHISAVERAGLNRLNEGAKLSSTRKCQIEVAWPHRLTIHTRDSVRCRMVGRIRGRSLIAAAKIIVLY